jgi:hypothetical protein
MQSFAGGIGSGEGRSRRSSAVSCRADNNSGTNLELARAGTGPFFFFCFLN